MSAARLPQVGGDQGNWGSILNEFLSQSLNNDGTLKGGIPQSKIQGLETALATKVSTSGTVTQLWSGTQAQYNALPSKNPTTLYVITET